MKFLAPFVGEWAVEVTFPGQPPAGEGARTTFEFMPGERFLIQRWEVPIPGGAGRHRASSGSPMATTGCCSTTSTPAAWRACTR